MATNCVIPDSKKYREYREFLGVNEQELSDKEIGAYISRWQQENDNTSEFPNQKEFKSIVDKCNAENKEATLVSMRKIVIDNRNNTQQSPVVEVHSNNSNHLDKTFRSAKYILSTKTPQDEFITSEGKQLADNIVKVITSKYGKDTTIIGNDINLISPYKDRSLLLMSDFIAVDDKGLLHIIGYNGNNADIEKTVKYLKYFRNELVKLDKSLAFKIDSYDIITNEGIKSIPESRIPEDEYNDSVAVMLEFKSSSNELSQDALNSFKEQGIEEVPSAVQQASEANNTPEVNQQQQFVNHSGGADGSDSYWGKVGEKYGVKQNHYYHNKKTPKGNIRQSEEDYKEGYDKAKKAAENMGRTWIEQYADLQARNWNQVKYSDAIFAIGHLVKPGEKNKKGFIVKAVQVDGGTGYAVQMAITENKPVYVFDQERNRWFKHIDGKWSESDVPTLTQNFAGIGTRELNDNGKKAIEDVYAKTFNVSKSETPVQQTNNPVNDIPVNNQPSFVPSSVDIKPSPVGKSVELKQAFSPLLRREIVSALGSLFCDSLKFRAKEYVEELQDTQKDNTQKGISNKELDNAINNLLDIEKRIPTYLNAKGIKDVINSIKEDFKRRKALYQKKADENPSLQGRVSMLSDRFDTVEEYLSELLSEAAPQIEENTGVRLSFIKDVNGEITTAVDESNNELEDPVENAENAENENNEDTVSVEGVKYRFINPYALMSKEIKMILSDIEMLDKDYGKDDGTHFVKNPLGGFKKMPVKQTYAILQKAFGEHVLRPDDFYYIDESGDYHFPVFDKIKAQHPWVESLGNYLEKEVLYNNNKEVLSKFYTAMRMDFIAYDGIMYFPDFHKVPFNQIEKINGLMKEAMNTTVNAIPLTDHDLYSKTEEICRNNAKDTKEILSSLRKSIETLRSPNFRHTKKEINDIAEKAHAVIQRLGINVDLPQIRGLVAECENKDAEDSGNETTIEKILFTEVQQVVDKILKGEKYKGDGKTNRINDYSDIVNNFPWNYKHICSLLSSVSELSNESSFKANGKNYQSYSTPNLVGELVKEFGDFNYWVNKAKMLHKKDFIGKQIKRRKGGSFEWVPITEKNYTYFSFEDYAEVMLRDRIMEKYGNKNWYYDGGKFQNRILEVLYDSPKNAIKSGLMQKRELLSIGDKDYSEWSSEDILSLAECYFNENALSEGGFESGFTGTSVFNLPILADSPVCMMVTAEISELKYKDNIEDNPKIYSRLRNIVKQELRRIQLVSDRKKKGIKEISNFDKNGKNFCFFPMLNTIYGEDVFLNTCNNFIKNLQMEELDNYIDNAMQKVMEALIAEEEVDCFINDDIIKTSRMVKSYYNGEVTDEDINYLRRGYYVNAILARAEWIQLTTVDLAYYKNFTDFQKRYKEVYANGKKLNTNAEGGRKIERSIYLKDRLVVSRQFRQIKTILNRAVERGDMKSYDRDNFLHKFKEINATDAQAFRCLSSMRAVSKMVGSWTPRQQAAFDNLQAGKYSPDDMDIVWGTIKPYMFTIIDKDSGTGETIAVPHQNKNSEFLLLTMFEALGCSAKSSMMKGLNSFMEKYGIDVAHFESAVKVGCENPIDISHSETKLNAWIKDNPGAWETILKTTEENKGTDFIESASNWEIFQTGNEILLDNKHISQNEYNERIDSMELSEEEVEKILTEKCFENPETKTSFNKNVVHELPYDNYCIQQPTPEHIFDSEVIFGSQFRNLIMSDIPVDKPLTVNGIIKTFGEWKRLYNQCIIANLKEDFNTVAELFGDIRKVQKKLLAQIQGNPKYGKDVEEALELIQEDGEIKFNLPLDNPNTTVAMQELLLSVFKNQITRQKIKGAACVLVSNIGYTSELNLLYEGEGENKRLAGVECYLPAVSKKFYKPFMIEKDGKVELDYNKLPDELKKGIGYRIPTEGKYSMIPLIIKGFLPQQNGSAIMLPEEITTMAGSDFDIDKLFMMLTEFYSKKEYDTKKAWSDFYVQNPEIKGQLEKAKWEEYWKYVDFTLSEDPSTADYLDKESKRYRDLILKKSGVKNTDLVKDLYSRFEEWFSKNKRNYYLTTSFHKVKFDYDRDLQINNNDPRKTLVSRKARNNMVLDIAHAVLTSTDMASHVLRAGNFDEVKMCARFSEIVSKPELLEAFINKYGLGEDDEVKTKQNVKRKLKELLDNHALDEFDSFYKKFSKQNNPLTLGGFMHNHQQNMLGAKMIGIYANNTSQQAKYQNAGFTIKEGYQFSINGLNYNRIDEIKNKKGDFISFNCAQFSAASVDNAKDPVLASLMQDPDTANITGFLLRAGVPIQEITLIFQQPLFKALYNGVDIKGKRVKAVNSWNLEKYMKANGIKYDTNINQHDFTTDELMDSILGIEEIDENLMYSFLFNIFVCAEAVNDITMVSRADSPNGATKSTIAQLNGQLMKNNIMHWKSNGMVFPFDGIDNIVKNNFKDKDIEDLEIEEFMSSPTPMLQAFHTYGLDSISSVLKKYFLQFHPRIKDMVETIGLQSPLYNTDDFYETFYSELVEYSLTKTKLFGADDNNDFLTKREHYLYEFPAEFVKILKENEEFKKMPIAKVITVKSGEIVYSGNSDNPTLLEYLKGDMEQLLYSNDPVLNRLATDLLKYTYYKNGLTFDYKGLGKLFSTSFLTSFPEYINTLRNIRTMTNTDPRFLQRFGEQFVINHPEFFKNVDKAESYENGIAVSAKAVHNAKLKGFNVRSDEEPLLELIAYKGTMYTLTKASSKTAVYMPLYTLGDNQKGLRKVLYNADMKISDLASYTISPEKIKANAETNKYQKSWEEALEERMNAILKGIENIPDLPPSFNGNPSTGVNIEGLQKVDTVINQYVSEGQANSETIC
jgi:hypothetical protein